MKVLKHGNKSAIVQFVQLFQLRKSNTVVCVFTSSCNKTPIGLIVETVRFSPFSHGALKEREISGRLLSLHTLNEFLLNS